MTWRPADAQDDPASAAATEQGGPAAEQAPERARAGPEEGQGAESEQGRTEQTEQQRVAVADARSPAVRRGEYLFHAGGCTSCHTDRENGGARLAGGRRLVTEFGAFYAPNITPDPETGIGGWSEHTFIRAMKQGLAPDGSPYYPVFPYRWYARIYDFDLRDLKAYLDTVEPVRNRVPPHDLPYPYDRRALVHGWRLLDFEPGPAPASPARPRLWNRGSYLVNALAHCGACHTPRTALGTYRDDMFLGGSDRVPGDLPAPNITPDEETGIGGWSEEEIASFLETGLRPSGMPVAGSMAEMIEDTTSRLTAEDRRAIAAYLKSVSPVRHRPTGGAEGG
ncbi:MAG TPA: cytochrome c [Falsiroseomonas sp.]|jgi:mono/diheme cytochrome c family protein|nr:cytochrome c [Falsiroseomonas sp.]